jgi:hypothetical protein
MTSSFYVFEQEAIQRWFSRQNDAERIGVYRERVSGRVIEDTGTAMYVWGHSNLDEYQARVTRMRARVQRRVDERMRPLQMAKDIVSCTDLHLI